MQKSLARIQEQIEKLQRRASDLRSREAADVIKKIKVAIAHYNLSAEDLFGHSTPRGPRVTNGSAQAKPTRRAKPAKRASVPVKYRDDEGNTWTGRGSQPRWLVAHLKAGRKIGDFAVAPT